MSAISTVLILGFLTTLPLSDATPFEMISLPGGSFTRGVPGGTGYPNWTEIWLGADNPESSVIVSAFQIGSHEISLDLYRQFTDEYWDDIGLTYGWDDEAVYEVANAAVGTDLPGDWPAFFVNFFDALRFCNWLSSRDGFEPVYSLEPVGRSTGAAWHHDFVVIWNRSANGYRLPTEAEWEYAARAGGADTRHMPESVEVLNQVAWTSANSELSFHPVGQLEPNLWGLYDMLGNANEWVWDYYQPDYYERAPLRDPLGPDIGVWEWYEVQPERTRVARGGSFGIDPAVINAATRLPAHPGFRYNRTGIRLARNAQPGEDSIAESGSEAGGGARTESIPPNTDKGN